MSPSTPPDPRLVEDLIEAGVIALKRSRRKDITDERSMIAITRAADWLLERAQALRQ